MLSQGKMISSTFLFAMGWFTVSFAFPLEAQVYHLGNILTGLLGLGVSLPYPIVAYLYLKAGDRFLFPLLLVSQITIVVLSFVFLVNSWVIFIVLVTVTGFFQGVYWVSMEVSIGSIPGKRSAERYSVAWGIPSFITPIIAGFLLTYLNFSMLVIISGIILTGSIPFIQRYRIVVHEHFKDRLNVYHVIPLFFAGLVVGFFSYALIPMLKLSGFGYTTLGILGSILGASMAFGFFVFSVLKSDNIRKLNLLSAGLMAAPLLIAFSRNSVLIGAVGALAGFGVAVAFSKVLSYIFTTADPVRGTFYYELFIAIGYGSGSTIGGVLAALFGFNSILIVFAFPLFYLWYLLRNTDLRLSPSA